MSRRFALIAALTLTSMVFAQAPSKTIAAPLTPRKADEFVIHMPDGTQKLLSSYRGQVVLMAFMHTTCSHCQHTAGVLAKVQTEYAPKGVQILGVTFDAGARTGVPVFIKITGANFPVGFSAPDQVEKFMHLDGDYFVPMLAFIDRAGIIRSQIVSYGDPNSAADKFLLDQETTIRQELDKYLKAAAGPATRTGAAKQAPKS